MSISYEYMSQDEAETKATEYRQLPGLESAVALGPMGDKGWVVAVRPGWRLCDNCGGEGWAGDDPEFKYKCRECRDGWAKSEPGDGDS